MYWLVSQKETRYMFRYWPLESREESSQRSRHIRRNTPDRLINITCVTEVINVMEWRWKQNQSFITRFNLCMLPLLCTQLTLRWKQNQSFITRFNLCMLPLLCTQLTPINYSILLYIRPTELGRGTRFFIKKIAWCFVNVMYQSGWK